MTNYACENELFVTRLLFAALAILFVATLLYVAGALVWTGDQLVLTIESVSVVLW